MCKVQKRYHVYEYKRLYKTSAAHKLLGISDPGLFFFYILFLYFSYIHGSQPNVGQKCIVFISIRTQNKLIKLFHRLKTFKFGLAIPRHILTDWFLNVTIAY